MSTEIGLFYGSTTGMTEDVAFRMEESIRNLFPQLEVAAINIIDLEDPKDMFLPAFWACPLGTTGNFRTTGKWSSTKLRR